MKSFSRIELEFCKSFTDKLMRHPLAVPFLLPVNPNTDNAPDYNQRITKPMDLGTIRKKLEQNEYHNSASWKDDVNLVWRNAKDYNQDKKETKFIYHIADRLAKKCEKALRVIPKTEAELWTLKMRKINQKLKNFLATSPPEESMISRKPELALIHEHQPEAPAAPEEPEKCDENK